MPAKTAGISISIAAVETPIGGLLLASDGGGLLHALDFADCEERLWRLLDRRLGRHGYRHEPGEAPAPTGEALRRYFAGDLAAIDEIAVAFSASPFQERVWRALRRLPPGTTCSYGTLAAQLNPSDLREASPGKSGSARAVGHANGANPLCIVVPCHRLVAANGALTGYSGGLARKRWLLDHESWG